MSAVNDELKMNAWNSLVTENVSRRSRHSSEYEFRQKRPFLLRRHLVTLFMFFGTLNMYSLRTNISVAIVDMTANKTFFLENGSAVVGKEFDWNSKDKGYILGSAYIGQLSFSIIGGWMGSRFGGVQIFGSGLLAASIVTILTPVLNTKQIYPMIFLRILEGVFQAITFSSISEVWSRWFPSKERARLVGISFAGSYFGLSFCYAISGYVAKRWGWQSIFYVTGGICVIWCIFWFLCVREYPEIDPRITEKELKYLSEDIKHARKRTTEYPWIQIFTSRPVIAIAVRKFTHGFGSLFLKNVLPLFANDMLRYNIQNVGFISSLAVLFSICGLFSCSVLKDFMQSRSSLNATTITKTLTLSSGLCAYLLLVLAGFSTTEIPIITCLLLYPFFDAFSIFILYTNPIEISPEYASVIAGTSAMFYTCGHVIGPLCIGFIVVSQEAVQWRIVLCSIAAIELVGLLIYIALGSSEVQKFSKEKT